MDRRGQRAWPAAEQLMFLGRFLRSPRTVGAIAPSSRFLARRMVRGLHLGPGVRVVELGPGTGAFTGVIRDLLPESGRYLGIEREAAFVRVLRERLPGLEYLCDSVENLERIAAERGLLPLDHLISGLPFASLPAPVTLPILDEIHRSLREGGTFTTFQYLHAYQLSAARAFRREMRSRFGPISSWGVVMRNIPPALVLRWRKGTTGADRGGP